MLLRSLRIAYTSTPQFVPETYKNDRLLGSYVHGQLAQSLDSALRRRAICRQHLPNQLPVLVVCEHVHDSGAVGDGLGWARKPGALVGQDPKPVGGGSFSRVGSQAPVQHLAACMSPSEDVNRIWAC